MSCLLLDVVLNNELLLKIIGVSTTALAGMFVWIYLRSLRSLDKTADSLSNMQIWSASTDERVKTLERRTDHLEDGHARHSERLNTIEKEIESVKSKNTN